MIIVEGPDGAGKSTLVKEICDRFMLHEHDRGPRDRLGTDNRQKEILYTALGTAVSGVRPQVYDRLFFSELAYGKVWRNNVIFSDREQYFISQILCQLGAPVVFCMPGLEVVRTNIEASREKQLSQVADTIEGIYEQYERMMTTARNSGIRVLEYDYNFSASRAGVLSSIAEYLTERKYREW